VLPGLSLTSIPATIQSAIHVQTQQSVAKKAPPFHWQTDCFRHAAHRSGNNWPRCWPPLLQALSCPLPC
jgi:hypothetical protein